MPLRWLEAGLLLVSFAAFGLYGAFAAYSHAVERLGVRELNEAQTRQGARPGAQLREGALVGRLEVPRLGLSAIVLEGVSDRVLRVAAGHVPETAFPGQGGNTAIAAHRDGCFRALRGIRCGDRILFVTRGPVRGYRVSSTGVVSPGDTRVLQPTAAEILTLVTCYPFRFFGPAPQRFIVRAVAE